MTITAIKPIPKDLRKELSDYNVLWGMSDRIVNEMRSQDARCSYKKVQVLPTDPEWRFVWRYFHHDKPNRYTIKRIYCIYEMHQQQDFELNLSHIEKEAAIFRPTWNQESCAVQRAKAIERWKASADVFSSFNTIEACGRIKSFKEVKILPLWHGSGKVVCDSIAKLGFFYFGKTAIESYSTKIADECFFGNGIYFTNSARYASDIYSEGHLFLAWVSMREPFPVVGDPNHEDIKNLYTKSAYKNYNAYYIPVTSRNPSDPYEKIYYPTKDNETPHCDEFVVFNRAQTLPRFWIELEVELFYPPSDTSKFVNELIPNFVKLLQNPNIISDNRLYDYLCKELETVLTLKEHDHEENHEKLCNQLNKLLDIQKKISMQESSSLISQTAPVSLFMEPIQPTSTPLFQPITPFVEDNIESFGPSDNMDFQTNISFPNNPTAISYTHVNVSHSIPSIAFGKADWEKYFGDIGLESPLPANIEEILNGSCSFWPNKKVKETHVLMLIPNTVNGNPLTISYLRKLVKKPKSGCAIKRIYYNYNIKDALGEKSYPSHWLLMTKDLIPGSIGNGYSNNCKLIVDHNKKTGLFYELPHELEVITSILMHYFKTGEYICGNKPYTYTFSQDLDA